MKLFTMLMCFIFFVGCNSKPTQQEPSLAAKEAASELEKMNVIEPPPEYEPEKKKLPKKSKIVAKKSKDLTVAQRREAARKICRKGNPKLTGKQLERCIDKNL